MGSVKNEPDDKYSEPFQPFLPGPWDDDDKDARYDYEDEDDDWMSDLDDEEGDTTWGV